MLLVSLRSPAARYERVRVAATVIIRNKQHCLRTQPLADPNLRHLRLPKAGHYAAPRDQGPCLVASRLLQGLARQALRHGGCAALCAHYYMGGLDFPPFQPVRGPDTDALGANYLQYSFCNYRISEAPARASSGVCR